MPAGASAEGLLRQLPERVAWLHGDGVHGRRRGREWLRWWRDCGGDVRLRGGRGHDRRRGWARFCGERGKFRSGQLGGRNLLGDAWLWNLRRWRRMREAGLRGRSDLNDGRRDRGGTPREWIYAVQRRRTRDCRSWHDVGASRHEI